MSDRPTTADELAAAGLAPIEELTEDQARERWPGGPRLAKIATVNAAGKTDEGYYEIGGLESAASTAARDELKGKGIDPELVDDLVDGIQAAGLEVAPPRPSLEQLEALENELGRRRRALIVGSKASGLIAAAIAFGGRDPDGEASKTLPPAIAKEIRRIDQERRAPHQGARELARRARRLANAEGRRQKAEGTPTAED